MAAEKTFDVLLSEAPLYQKSGTVTLSGALARSPEEGKFALLQADGSAVELDANAVKSHTVIGSSFGQQIVQVELDAEQVPKDLTEQAYIGFTTPSKDNYTHPSYPESSLGPRDLLTILPDAGYLHPIVGIVPFSLVTGHQAPDSTVNQI